MTWIKVLFKIQKVKKISLKESSSRKEGHWDKRGSILKLGRLINMVGLKYETFRT